MSDEATIHQDDSSHYEISLTAGQAFLAFVLLLLSLAASFAFGLMIGKGQADERLVVRKEPAVITEGNVLGSGKEKKSEGRIVELGVADDDFKAPATESAAPATETPEAPPAPVVTEVAPPPAEAPAAPLTPDASPAPIAPTAPAFAQLFSSADQKTAEAFAAKLIDKGFTTAYVERMATEKGQIYRVRVRFASDAEARAAEPKLREFSKEVWITK